MLFSVCSLLYVRALTVLVGYRANATRKDDNCARTGCDYDACIIRPRAIFRRRCAERSGMEEVELKKRAIREFVDRPHAIIIAWFIGEVLLALPHPPSRHIVNHDKDENCAFMSMFKMRTFCCVCLLGVVQLVLFASSAN